MLKGVPHMANEEKKDFNAMLRKAQNMPRVDILEDEKSIKRYGGPRMFFAPPLFFSNLMAKIPAGKVITSSELRAYLAMKNDADFTEPLTAGAFIGIAAWASEQREHDKIPYWRTLKAQGEINAKFPGGIEKQKALLEAEGHTIIQKGRKNIRYFVSDYEMKLAKLD